MTKAYFITGTDTEVGKTWSTLTLLHYFKQHGHSVVGMKPVAAGCSLSAQGEWQNDDALLLQQHASCHVDYPLINPYAYPLALSPHLAGKSHPVNLSYVRQCFDQIRHLADIILVEGAGGWYSPINAHQTNSDLAQCLGVPVVIVVAIRLGCINHARLSYEAVRASGLDCAGWIAVCIDPKTLQPTAVIDTIKQQLPVPLISVIPYAPQADFERFAMDCHWE